MKRALHSLLFVGFIAAAPAAELEQTDDVGWFRDRQVVLQEVKNVAVLPATFSIETPHEEAAADIIESRIEAAIAEAGFAIIPASTFRDFYHEMKVTMGGYYDPFTGEIDAEKFKKITELTYREFEREHEFEAYFRVSAQKRRVYFSGNWARWDGTEAPVSGKTSWGSGTGGYGTVPALSLVGLMFTSDDEKALFLHASGVQLLSLIKGRTFIAIPAEKLLSEPEAIEDAMDRLTAPLVTATLTEEALERQQQAAKKAARQ